MDTVTSSKFWDGASLSQRACARRAPFYIHAFKFLSSMPLHILVSIFELAALHRPWPRDRFRAGQLVQSGPTGLCESRQIFLF